MQLNIAVWMWRSIMPGISVQPCASITSASRGTCTASTVPTSFLLHARAKTTYGVNETRIARRVDRSARQRRRRVIESFEGALYRLAPDIADDEREPRAA